MDLREYAISQKIQGKSDLLNYVVNNKDVPVDVLETSFSDLLTEQTDAHVADISNDYIKYLKERVKVGIIPLGDHKFEVSGDISDNELEVIELLTGEDKDTVVKRLLDNVLNELRGHKDLDISEIEFSESEIKEAIKHANDKVEEIVNMLPELPAHEEVEETHEAHEVEEAHDAEEAHEVEAHEDVHDEVEEIIERPQMFEDDEDDIEDDEISEDSFEIDLDEINFGDNSDDEQVDDSEDDYEQYSDYEDEYPNYDDEDLDDEESDEYDEESGEYLDEESYVDADQVDEQSVPEDVILDIYNSVVGDIRARGLDKKLNLNI